MISDTLEAKGIDLIVLLAPGKASFYPEYIPEHYNPEHKATNNYEVYRKEIMQANIHLLDFNKWFRDMKANSDYPLFPKTGIHWSMYGEMLSIDSIIKYINTIHTDNKIPELLIRDIETSANKMKGTDDDIEKGMNLLFNIKDLQMGYPQIEIQNDTSASPPKVLTVADSYYWSMFNWGLSKKAFNHGQFWYYNKQIFPESYKKPLNVIDINIREEVEKNDVVLLLFTDANLHRFAFGFIDQLYDSYFKSDKNSVSLKDKKEERIQLYIHAIKGTPEWIESIKKKAQERKISLSEAIRKNAEYMVWRENNENTNR